MTSSNFQAEETFVRRRRHARVCALQALYQCDLSEDWTWTSKRWDLFWKQLEEDGGAPLPPEDRGTVRAFARRLVEGVCAHRADIDHRIQARARNWTLCRMNAVDRNVLRLAVFELFYRSDIPLIVSVDEAVELAKAFGDRDSGKFVNGILDRLMHDAAETPASDSAPMENTE